jgi:hypothetical protein
MYGHPFRQIAKLLPVGLRIYSSGATSVTDPEHPSYAESRFLEERPRMQQFAGTYEEITGSHIQPFGPDATSATLAWVSHTYQDIFNNPMQAFLPDSVYPCGKWALWGDLDDPINFRRVLYEDSAITEFRADFFERDFWIVELSGFALIKAMVESTAASSTTEILPSAISDACLSLELHADATAEELRDARDFVSEHEAVLERLIREYSKPRPAARGRSRSYPVGS